MSCWQKVDYTGTIENLEHHRLALIDFNHNEKHLLLKECISKLQGAPQSGD